MTSRSYVDDEWGVWNDVTLLVRSHTGAIHCHRSHRALPLVGCHLSDCVVDFFFFDRMIKNEYFPSPDLVLSFPLEVIYNCAELLLTVL